MIEEWAHNACVDRCSASISTVTLVLCCAVSTSASLCVGVVCVAQATITTTQTVQYSMLLCHTSSVRHVVSRTADGSHLALPPPHHTVAIASQAGDHSSVQQLSGLFASTRPNLSHFETGPSARL